MGEYQEKYNEAVAEFKKASELLFELEHLLGNGNADVNREQLNEDLTSDVSLNMLRVYASPIAQYQMFVWEEEFKAKKESPKPEK